MIEANYIIYDTESGASYRVRPNPDGDALDGSHGLVIEYRDGPEDDWDKSLFIAPQAASGIAEAISRFTQKAAKP